MTQSQPTFDQATDVETMDDLELEVNDDANLSDVDVPEDESEDIETTEGEAAAKPSSTPRTKAPEGFVKPVEFAKILTEHLRANGTLPAEKTVPPQVVYSYLKNNAAGSKNPFPVHTVGDYDKYIKPDEGLEWWDTKNQRVTAAKTAAAEKKAKKADKPADAGEATEASSAEVTEAE
jgi:hypothetical protein